MELVLKVNKSPTVHIDPYKNNLPLGTAFKWHGYIWVKEDRRCGPTNYGKVDDQPLEEQFSPNTIVRPEGETIEVEVIGIVKRVILEIQEN